MNELFKILGTIAIDASGVDGELNKTVNSANKTGGKLRSVMQGIGMGIGQMVVQGAQQITQFVGQAMSASDSLNKYASTMKFAGFDEKTIESSKNVFKKYADDTVYDLNTIMSTGAQLASNGIKNFQSLTLSAGNLNAVAGGNAETFKSLSMVLTQTAGTGKLTTENWNQLADAIPGASGVLQKAMLDNGAYTGNFRKAMENGEITAEEFNTAIEQLGSKPVAVEAAKSTQTFEGAIGQLEATAVDGINKVVEAIGKNALTGGITAFGGLLGKAFEQVATWTGQAKNSVMAFWVELQKSGAISSFQNLIGSVSIVMGTVNNLVSQFFGAFTGGANAQGIMSGLADAVKQVADWLTIGSNYVGSFLTTLQNNGALSTFGGLLSGVFKDAFGYLGTIGGTIGGVIDTIMGAFQRMDFSGIIQLAKDYIPAIQNGFQTMWGIVQPAFDQFVQSFTNLWNASQPFISTIFGALMPVIQVVASFVGGVLNGVLTGLSGTFDLLAGAVKFFTPVLNIVVGAFKLVAPVLSAIAQGIGVVVGLFASFGGSTTSLKTMFTSAWQNIGNAMNSVSRIFEGVFNFLRGGFNGLLNTVRSVWNGITGAISGAVNSARNTVTSVFNAISGAISGTINGIRGTVTNVFNGIKSAMSGPIESAKNVISGIVNTIKGLFNFNISFPRIPLPHFGISPSGWQIGDLLKGSIPTLGIDWYADGGIMDGATPFGTNGNNLMVGGEAGREAILPLTDKVLGGIGQGILQATGGMGGGTINFTQNNYSPEALTPREIEKRTRKASQDLLGLINQ